MQNRARLCHRSTIRERDVAHIIRATHVPYDKIFSPLSFRNLDDQESHSAIEHRGTLRQLRRHRRAGAHQLGSEVRARRSGRDHLVVRAGASARAHPAQLRDDRQRRSHSVLARARQSRARARLQVHPPAQPWRTAARHRDDRLPEGPELDRRRRIRCTGSNARR